MGSADHCHGFGLTGSRDRFDALGGWVTVAERAGGGTVVTATFPPPALYCRTQAVRRGTRGVLPRNSPSEVWRASRSCRALSKPLR